MSVRLAHREDFWISGLIVGATILKSHVLAVLFAALPRSAAYSEEDLHFFQRLLYRWHKNVRSAGAQENQEIIWKAY